MRFNARLFVTFLILFVGALALAVMAAPEAAGSAAVPAEASHCCENT